MAARKKFIFNVEQVISYSDDNRPKTGCSVTRIEANLIELERRWKKLVASYEEIMTADDGVHNEQLLNLAPKKLVRNI